MQKNIDCVVAGTCVLDILVRPIDLDAPLGGDRLFEVDAIETSSGGIVCNSGAALARLGCQVAALSCVGDDLWGHQLRQTLGREGIDTSGVVSLPDSVTSTTAVLIAESGERTFAHHPGAGAKLNPQHFEENFALIARSRSLLVGYYSLLPELEPDLPALFAKIRDTGCRVALDAGGSGGGMELLEPILPQLDYYVPSRTEAEHQTGETDPQRIIRIYRDAGAPGVVGLKLGTDGALISDADGKLHEIACATPPGDVVDTTGAGDAFYGGLLAGFLRGDPLERAGKLAAGAAACCVSGYGASAGLKGYEETATIAGLM